jgi:hypothetical protein
MASEVELKPGWLLKDVRQAARRLDQWANAYNARPLRQDKDRKVEQSHSDYEDKNRSPTAIREPSV